MESRRGIVSCASCRHRKLKCDRQDPCANCTSRGFVCVYHSQGRARTAKSRQESDNHLADRIRQLEQLVNTIVTKGSPARDQSGTSNTSPTVSNGGQSDSAESGASEIKAGQVIRKDNETIYVSSMHWSSLCAEISDLRDEIDMKQEASHDIDFYEQQALGVDGPMLLDGGQATFDMQTVLLDVPNKEAVDKLVYRYFNGSENSIAILHLPTFQSQYARFWQDSTSVSVPWISLLFGIMAIGTLFCVKTGEDLSFAFKDPRESVKVFQRRSTDCLLISKYSTTPGPYTLEALLINAQNEFFRRRDAHLGVWVLGGIAIRLAMRMGYHRDASHYPQISPFEGEIRRRIWSIMTQIDGLTSYMLGLPPMIHESVCDTQIPRNLQDEDFGPDSVFLPPSRPSTDLTPILYVITKAELGSVFRRVYLRVVLGRTDSYDEIMALDRRLEAAHLAISPRFQGFNLDDAVTTPPYVMVRRYTIEILYLKTICMLHRHHMTLAFAQPEFGFSRHRCLTAAMLILHHHNNILRQMQSGGTLYRNAMFVSSLEQNDFLLASIVVCVELSNRQSRPHQQPGQVETDFSRKDLTQALREAHEYLAEAKDSSSECQHAFNVLTVMLRKFSETSGAAQRSQEAPMINVVAPAMTANAESDTLRQAHPFDAMSQLGVDFMSGSEANSTPSNFQDISAFFTSPDDVDWDLWENFIRESAIPE